MTQCLDQVQINALELRQGLIEPGSSKGRLSPATGSGLLIVVRISVVWLPLVVIICQSICLLEHFLLSQQEAQLLSSVVRRLGCNRSFGWCATGWRLL